jgi:Uma2 family endonuclease
MNVMTQPTLTLEAFLAWENEQPERHEFYKGEIFAMVGGRRVHGIAVVNLVSALATALKGTPCRVFSESMKLQVADDTILYPDLFVTCDRADLRTDLIFRSPTVVMEVLSPSTQGYDRSQKFALYRRISTLREYFLIDPDSRRVECFRRDDSGRWVFHDQSEAAELSAASIDVAVPLADLFAGIEPPPDEAPAAP